MLSPKFLLSLINLEQLKLIIERRCYSSEQDIQEWKKYLLIASFPKLQYLETQYLSPHGVCGVKEIILNCNKLRKLEIFINFEDDDDDHEREIICDEILNYLLNYSSRNFDEFAFDQDWRFSVNNLKNFFEGWRGRNPIKFVTHFHKCHHFTQKHIEIVQEYYDEGVIDKDTRSLYGVNDF
ncbi:uncharacterized protein OCT59_026033 [Rhizophagus irregularis]|uniref:Uncharacterized protein n=1 Tax=Rhizophagus irregularis (strain DAOM 197198w) TaxID=1432141 RepID=A0A015LMT6_RHIIW|nr:hypothetical protein RirG_055010 [Rhizophagus irregularis DAOM 197198w]UZO05689.1 hypothetical protein OCT59_026033 [Rhizophagus irregularis]